MHRILAGGVSRVVPRVNWVRNNTYESWSDTATNYYVLVREFISGVPQLNVYKCLYSPGTPSINPPTGGFTAPTRTADGYYWQFLYTIDNSSAIRFLTEDWMPVPEKVQQSEVASLTRGTARYRQWVLQQNAQRGTIYSIGEVSSDFLDSDSDAINIFAVSGNDSEATTFTGSIFWDSSRQRSSFRLTQPGVGYTNDARIHRDSVDGPTLSVRPNVSPGFGHGGDAPLELNAQNLMLVVRNVPQGDFLPLATNEFKMVNLVLNPIDRITNNLAQNDFYIACRYFDTDGPHEFRENDRIKSGMSGESEAIVVAVSSRRVYYVIDKENQEAPFINDSDTVYSLDESKSVVVRRSYNRQVIFDSHETIVADFKLANTTRSQDQIESLNFILKF